MQESTVILHCKFYLKNCLALLISF